MFNFTSDLHCARCMLHVAFEKTIVVFLLHKINHHLTAYYFPVTLPKYNTHAAFPNGELPVEMSPSLLEASNSQLVFDSDFLWTNLIHLLVAVRTENMLWLPWPKLFYITLGKFCGRLQRFSNRLARSTSDTSPSISRRALWSLVLGHTMATRYVSYR